MDYIYGCIILLKLLMKFRIVPKWIQQKISRRVTETNSQKLLLNSKTVNNNHDQTMKFTPSAVGLPPFHQWVCLHHTFVLSNLIVRCLTGSHMIISSKSNYRARLNVNMNTADSVSLHFNFGKGYYFVLWVKRQIFDIARFF